MTSQYPSNFSDINNWSSNNGIAVDEARRRFAQYAILRAIASSRILSSILVFKGGNALDFIWQPNRSTIDLDFSADMTTAGPVWNIASFGTFIRRTLGPALKVSTEQLGVVLIIHSVKPEQPSPDKTLITFKTKVGYALPDEIDLIQRISLNQPSTHTIPVEISMNESICADQSIDIRATNRLRVSTVEDIIAEKLRALLQQPIRKRTRPQDLLDIVTLLNEQPNIEQSRIVEFLLQKSASRDILVSRSAFHDPQVAERAAYNYAALKNTTRKLFIPFEEAFRTLLNFTDNLPIPEEPLVE